MNAQQKSDLCQRALAAVPDRERLICEMAYGFTYGGVMSDEMIGEEIGLPRSTVQWTRDKALRTMRGVLTNA